MTRSALRRIAEAFFQRWPLYALLFVASLAIGYSRLQQTGNQYVSNGAIAVDSETLVTVQSGVRSGPSFNYLSPAQFTSQELFGLIVTDVFMESVVAAADIELSPMPAVREGQLHDLRLAMTVYPSNGNIVQINATTADPELSAALAQAVIDEYIKFQIQVDIAESEASKEFFTELAASYRTELDEARADVDAALRGIAPDDDISPERRLEIDRLQEAEAQADARYQEAVDNLEVARLAALQTETDIRQSYSILDVPAVPSEPGGRLFHDVMTIAMYGLVGVILALVLPVFSALMTRTLVFADDLAPGAPVQVIATIPRLRKRDLDLGRAPGIEPLTDHQLAPLLGPPGASSRAVVAHVPPPVIDHHVPGRPVPVGVAAQRTVGTVPEAVVVATAPADHPSNGDHNRWPGVRGERDA